MNTYGARISWQRNGAEFSNSHFSRSHEWSFDGGVTVPASASPLHVPPPHSVAAAVDPEEALVAAASSCHMLWFLSLAAKRGFIVDSYADDADGVMGETAAGRLSITRIVLRPKIDFSGTAPSDAELAALHDEAHEHCYIANSLKAEIQIESR